MPRKLIFTICKKDFDVQTFRAGGKGGQHQNKTSSGVRIVHRESKAVGESRTDRSQYRNKRIALVRLIKEPLFKIWLQRKVREIVEKKTIDQKVEEDMEDRKLFIEVRNEKGIWRNLSKDR